MSSWRKGSPSPAAMRMPVLTMSTPVTISVTQVLDLDARVHLHEVEAAVRVEQELDRAGALVVRGDGGGDGRPPICARSSGRHGRRGRLLDELLVAPLDRAVALAEVDGVALAVGQHLDLDVARRADVLLDVDGAVAERRLGLGLRLAHGGRPARRRP